MSAARPLDEPRWHVCWLCGAPAPKMQRVTRGLAPWWPQSSGTWLPLHRYANGMPEYVGEACSPLCRELAGALIAAATRLMEG